MKYELLSTNHLKLTFDYDYNRIVECYIFSSIEDNRN